MTAAAASGSQAMLHSSASQGTATEEDSALTTPARAFNNFQAPALQREAVQLCYSPGSSSSSIDSNDFNTTGVLPLDIP